MTADAESAWCDELIEDFITESLEHLSTVESDLLLLEGDEDTTDSEVVNQLFRSVHSVKGGAGFLGLQTINRLAHRLESVMDRIREGELEPAESIIDALLKGTDRLRELVVAAADANSDDDDDIEEQLSLLDPYIAASLRQDSDDSVVEDDKSGITHANTEPEVAATTAEDNDAPVESPTNLDAGKTVSDEPNTSEPGTAEGSSSRGSKAEKPTKPVKSIVPKPASSIRVSTDVLDRLMNLSGELVLGRNQLVQVLATDATESRDRVVGHLNQVVSDLQETVMRTRMQPIDTVLNRFPRLVRDLSQRVGKECELTVYGRDVDVDRTILESLGDPLTHLVRNAIDHGLEDPDERRQTRKPDMGKIELVASHLGSNVLIEISDDGRGINPDVIRSKAIEKGVLTADHAAKLSDTEAVELIFHAGFSTKEEITDLSGRGVGMDVVRSNIEGLGGSIQISSTFGEGTTFTITIPLTLAIMHGLVLSCADRRYVLPQLNVVELVRVKTGDLASRVVAMQGRDVLRLRGELLPVVDIEDAVRGMDPGTEIPRPVKNTKSRSRNFLIVETGKVRYGIAADSALDTEEIVVKPLGRHLDRLPQYSGATILGDGTVAMILDVSGIAARMDIRPVELGDEAAESSDKSTTGDRLNLVVFRNHEADAFAVPLCQLARIYRIARDEISNLGKVCVHQQEDIALPLIALHDWIDAASIEHPEQLCVLVMKTRGGQEIGILAPFLDDIQELDLSVDNRTLKAPGILGSFQLDGRTVRLIAVQELVELALPHFEKSASADATAVDVSAEDGKRRYRMLYAEDSQFFRQNFSASLRRLGHDVVLCEDGEAAWTILKDPEQAPFDLLITDIEMPRCNGYELARRVRGDASLSDLPIVAMTSLSSERDRKSALEAGINAHLVKMDDSAFVDVLASLMTPEAAHA